MAGRAAARAPNPPALSTGPPRTARCPRPPWPWRPRGKVTLLSSHWALRWGLRGRGRQEHLRGGSHPWETRLQPHPPPAAPQPLAAPPWSLS